MSITDLVQSPEFKSVMPPLKKKSHRDEIVLKVRVSWSRQFVKKNPTISSEGVIRLQTIDCKLEGSSTTNPLNMLHLWKASGRSRGRS